MARYEYSWAADAPYLVYGRHGVFRGKPNDVYIGRSLATYGEYSEIELRGLLQLLRPGDVAIEAGANIGSHSIALARRVGPEGRLFAFEPQAETFAILQRNIELNRLENVSALAVAVGARAETLYHDPPPGGATANFGGVSMSRGQGRVATPSAPLDEAIDAAGLGPIRLLKIDVEGMEEDVLVGAERLINAHRPQIYLENDRVDRSASLIQRLLDMDYCPFWSTPAMFNPHNFFGVAQNVFGGILSLNMLCIPKEALDAAGIAGAVRDPSDRPVINGRRL